MTELSQQEILEKLKTRGFESGGFRSPLRYFRGRLDSITGSMVQRGAMVQARLEVAYNFSDVEVFETTEPYPFPIAQITIMHSNRTKSGMGVLGASMDKLINSGLDENIPQSQAKNQDFLIGKLQEWRVTPGHLMWDGNENKEVPRECWEVVWVEGTGGIPHSGVATEAPELERKSKEADSSMQRALRLLDGKTQQQWNNVVFQDTAVKSDATLINSIITGQFLPPLEESGVLTKDDDGVYHLTSPL